MERINCRLIYTSTRQFQSQQSAKGREIRSLWKGNQRQIFLLEPVTLWLTLSLGPLELQVKSEMETTLIYSAETCFI